MQVLSGLHENIGRTLKYMDHDLKKTVSLLNTFCDADKWNRMARGGGDFGLLVYVPVCILHSRMRVAAPERVRIEWPRGWQTCRRQRLASHGLLHSWRQGVAPLMARCMDVKLGAMVRTALNWIACHGSACNEGRAGSDDPFCRRRSNNFLVT